MFCPQLVPMVLEGRKPMTRRAVKPAPAADQQLQVVTGSTGFQYVMDSAPMRPYPEARRIRWDSPYGQPGDRLWMRETFYAWGRWETRFSAKKGRDEWHFVDLTQECGMAYRYHADETLLVPPRGMGGPVRWWKRPAIFMPRAASRCSMQVQSVRVERLQDISEADARAEGIFPHVRGGWHWLKHDSSNPDDWNQFGYKTAALAFQALWESINGPDSWAANPWVWVVAFQRLRQASTVQPTPPTLDHSTRTSL